MIDESMPATSQLRKEIMSLIKRYGDESNITVYEAIGTLEIVKSDLIEMINQEN